MEQCDVPLYSAGPQVIGHFFDLGKSQYLGNQQLHANFMHGSSRTMIPYCLNSLHTGELLAHRETDARSTRHCWLMVERRPNTYGQL